MEINHESLYEAVVLAAGRGSRLRADGTNKAMELIGHKPLICFAIDALIAAGIEVIWIVKYHTDSFDALDLLYKDRNVQLKYINEYKHLGSLHSFALTEAYINSKFVILDCDLIIDKSAFVEMLRQGIAHMDREQLLGVMAQVQNPSKSDTNMLLIENQRVTRFIKTGRSDCVRGGYVFLWSPEVFCDTARFLEQNIYSLSEYYDYLAQKCEIGVMDIEDIWDVDTPEDIEYTLNRLKEERK